MPRIAIKDFNTSFFHIMVQGIRKEFIFNSDKDKQTYLSLILKYLKKFNLKIISYCIMDNHAHFLIFTKKINVLSEFMHSLNTSYAIYYNKTSKKQGYVFRNRYKAEPIYNSYYLINCIHYIHNNPIKANLCNNLSEYIYSSYYEYLYNKGSIIPICKERFSEINLLFIDKIFKEMQIDYTFMDFIEEKNLKDKSVIISEFIKNNYITKNEITLNKIYLKQISKKLHEECGLTHQEIANEFNVSRTKITRLINSI